MKIIKYVKEMKDLRRSMSSSFNIGFVPTMGFLHEGHLSLVENAKNNNKIIIVSIFVNPTQFAPNEDFDSYPRNIENDLKLLNEKNVDYVFLPNIKDIYPNNYSTYIEETNLTKKLCGKSRPNHFKGVTTVVNKLFNIIQPNNAYFGQKDAQQFRVLRKMVIDLNLNVNLIECPILREDDGLAMSSRNVFLNDMERKQALSLNLSIKKALDLLKINIYNKEFIINEMKKIIENYDIIKIDYIDILKEKNLEDFEDGIINEDALIAGAIYSGKTRLIDNSIFRINNKN